MRKTVSILLGFAVLLFVGCETADQKIPEMATDYCNCLGDMEKNLSSKTKEIFKKVANATDPERMMTNEMAKLNEEDKVAVSTELISISEWGDKDSKVGRCMLDVDKKYEKARTYNKKKFQEKLIRELESKTGCSFTASIVKASMKITEQKD